MSVLPRSLDWMRFGVEDHFVEVQRIRRREEQIEVFESLGEEETLHRVGFFLCQNTFQRGIAFVRSAVLNKIFPERFAHP